MFGFLLLSLVLVHASLVQARAGGGGSGGGGGGGGAGGSGSGEGNIWEAIFFIGIVVFAFGYKIYTHRQKVKKAKEGMLAASRSDASWTEQGLRGEIELVFYRFQKDWSDFNLASMREYLAEKYFTHVQLMMTALRNIGRQNVMENVILKKSEVVEVNDETDNELDRFVVEIRASAHDSLKDTVSGKTLYQDNSAFSETWLFDREVGKWKLDGISQVSEERYSEYFASFASKNGFFYSRDWGWLLLPQRGQLFSLASFKRSDINHHVIGIYHGALVEFYEYIPFASQKNPRVYTIAQATLPKSYGNIVVQHRKWYQRLLLWRRRGLTAVSLEWNAFNDKYEVLASEREKVTVFELLHPAFMEKLEALPFETNIEVVDNVVYLYTDDSKAQYEAMLGILKEAFDEMKL